jgi:hypothetical protein
MPILVTHDPSTGRTLSFLSADALRQSRIPREIAPDRPICRYWTFVPKRGGLVDRGLPERRGGHAIID